jgi:DNA-binding transcriptional ArsR family regulator
VPTRAAAAKRHEAHGPNPAKSPSRPAPAPYATATGGQSGFDRLIYERVRLGIMSALATNEELTFNELKSLFNASDGNLGAHARKLEEAGYVACTKSFEARRPKSIYRITAAGRKALLRYLEHIEAVIKATRRI